MVEAKAEAEFNLTNEIARIQEEAVAAKVTKFLDPSAAM